MSGTFTLEWDHSLAYKYDRKKSHECLAVPSAKREKEDAQIHFHQDDPLSVHAANHPFQSGRNTRKAGMIVGTTLELARRK